MNMPQVEVSVYRAVGDMAEPLVDRFEFDDLDKALREIREGVLARVERGREESGFLVIGLHWWDAQPFPDSLQEEPNA